MKENEPMSLVDAMNKFVEGEKITDGNTEITRLDAINYKFNSGEVLNDWWILSDEPKVLTPKEIVEKVQSEAKTRAWNISETYECIRYARDNYRLERDLELRCFFEMFEFFRRNERGIILKDLCDLLTDLKPLNP